MAINDSIITLSVHDWEEHWDMRIDLSEVFYGIEPKDLPDYEPDPDSLKITRWQRIKGIIKLIKKKHLEDDLKALKEWLRQEKDSAEELREAHKAGSPTYKEYTKIINLLDRAIREAEK